MVRLYNTLTRTKEQLIPRHEGKVDMFVCGPTVYNYAHIGNMRSMVSFDMIAKYLRLKDYEVTYLQNITDIDDKIIIRAQEEKKEPLALAKEYEEIFHEDEKKLHINSISRYARATDHIPEIIQQVKTLIAKGHVYLIENDGYYFDLTTFSHYGKLSGRTTEMADDGVTRIDESVNKKNKGDFCVWKLSPPAGGPGEPFWEDAQLGNGRPGWHIEDTAIAEKYLGPQYDLHGGGQDLVFPHHEAEIAQEESISGKRPFVKYWLHGGFLVMKSAKMSKSKGNFKTAHELLEQYSPEGLRFYLLSAHYRAPLDFDEKNIIQAEAAVRRIAEFLAKLEKADGTDNPAVGEKLKVAEEKFIATMDDDFNVPAAVGILFELIRDLNPLLGNRQISKSQAEETQKLLKKFDSVLGIISYEKTSIPHEVTQLVDEREKERENKNWEKADKLRHKIESLGYLIEDTSYGPFVKKK